MREEYMITEEPLNVTLLGEKVGYRIDSMDKLGLALEDLAKLTSHSTVQEIQALVNELSLAALFTLLVAPSHQESLTNSVHTICKNYLSTLPTTELLRAEFYHYFLAGLQSSQPSAVHLALDQLSRIDFSDSSQVDIRMATAIASNLEAESLKVSQAASQVIKKFFVEPVCLEAFLNAPEVSSKLRNILQNPICMMRVVEVIFDSLATLSINAPHCDLLKKANLISPIFSACQNDPLLRFNLLETFGRYINAPIPRALVLEFHVIDEAILAIESLFESQDTTLRGELKFLVVASLSGVEIPRLHDILKDCLTSDNLMLQDVGLHMSTLIFESPFGVKLMRSSPLFLRSVTQLCIASGQIKVDAIACVATLVGVSSNPDAELTEAAQLAYDLLGESMKLPQDLIKLAQTPSSEIKGPSYALLLHFTYHLFGVKAIINSPLAVSFLLDRSADSTPLGQKWKYGLIESLSRQISELKEVSGHEDFCSPELQLQLSKYLQEGVAYSQLNPTVALESS